MAIIPFGEWTPDAAALGNPGCIRVVNCYPGLTSYKPVAGLNAITSALTARPRGAIEALDRSNNVLQYAGDAGKLYQLSSSTWGDVSKSGGYTTGDEERWDLVRWKNKILATNFSDSPQQITMGDANFSDLTTDFRARQIAVVRDFVVAANTTDGTDGDVHDRVRWSAFNDETDWTVSPSTLSDFRDLQVGGGIQRLIGGEYGVIVSNRSTFRMSFAGAPTVFQIDEVAPGVGALSSGAVAQIGNQVFIWSEQGFVVLTAGSSLQFIGAGKVDSFARNDLDENYLYRISSIADPRSGRVYFAYPGVGNTGGRPNKIIVYDRIVNKWGFIEVEVELIWRAGATALTLEDLDTINSSLDALPASLDASQWKGGSPRFAGFDENFESGSFIGNSMDAQIDTKEVEINDGAVTQVSAFRPLIDAATVTARIGRRSRQTDAVTFGSQLTQSSSGRFTTRSTARYHRFRLELSGDWTDAIGVAVDPQDARPVGRRG